MSSLKTNARVAGILYIAASVVGCVRLIYIPASLFVQGNAAATAENIRAHEMLFRFGILTYLLGGALWLFVPLTLYRLFKGVDQTLAVIMVILGSLMITPLFFANSANDAAALLLARGADFLSVFTQPQREAFAMLFLHLHNQLDLANEIFWGVWLIPFGLLVYKSRFLPRILGIWLVLGCIGYLMLSFTGILYPAYNDLAFKFSQPFTLSELAVMLWLVIMGAKEKTAAAVAS